MALIYYQRISQCNEKRLKIKDSKAWGEKQKENVYMQRLDSNIPVYLL